ncbi:protein DEHYDRATION-INDUCED 19 homolog 4-like isoform X2 [Diospyros lotus]|uniref:protein DEHYDRATION-INDUCED 19 homolog 4-like isoform X2 n=1 Tax=Diospyros lotus TaxID=55363 RepID=UPI00224DBB7B|nr:protein DEHYDRATION-INDUCED 19 homolog 4-like isoform X2 [Diospyros lotus]
MDFIDSWPNRVSAASSRRCYSRSDPFREMDDSDVDEDSRLEFLCPFCDEDFDIVGLCCHIEEDHAFDAKAGVCPVCAKRVGMDLVGHITMQHARPLNVQPIRRLQKSGSNLIFSISRKELRDRSLQSIFGLSHNLVSSFTAEPDPLLSSFMYSHPGSDESAKVKSDSTMEASLTMESLTEVSAERNVRQSPLSDKDQEERARKCKFVQGLLLSTFLDDDDI